MEVNLDLVSIIITSYNSNSVFLETAIKSVLNQSYSNIEIIVVDDGSKNDACKKTVKKYSDEVIYIYQENKGLPAARNTGIKISTGQYVCFLDDDDEWLKDKLEKQLSLFKKTKEIDPNIGMTFSYCNVIDEANNLIGKHGNKVKGLIFKKILYGNIIGAPSSVMIEKKFWKM